MKHFFGLILAVVLLASCKQNGSTDTTSTSADGTATMANTEKASAPKGDLKDFSGDVGKKLKADNLMDKGNLTERLKTLMGADYSDFETDWTEETPLKQDAELLYVTVCRKGDCVSNKYFIILDLVGNTINVHNFKGTRVKTYEEGPIIGFTTNLSDDYMLLRKAQGL